MSFEIEIAKIELRIAEDMETVSAAEIVRWLQKRPALAPPALLATIERAVLAVGQAKRIAP